MATKAEKNELVEILKGNRVINFYEFIDKKIEEQQAFKKQFKRDWNSNHEKVEKQMEEKQKALELLVEEWLEIAYPEEKNIWKNQYTIQIVISKDATQ
jgi:hypothetical protein